ncbi:MAG TPA: penicillin-binding protein, partial [Candidatus Angelobacter sp.]
MKFRLPLFVVFVSALILFALSGAAFARTASTTTTKSKTTGHITETAHAQKRMAHLRHHRRAKTHVAAKATTKKTTAKAAPAKSPAAARAASGRVSSAHAATLKTVSLSTTAGTRRSVRRHVYVERFTGHSFSDDNTDGDIVEGEDPVVRQAAIDALGNMNGTVVAIDPTSGRILAMVNQKLALSEGAQPCSTIKVAVALAG